MLDGQPLQKCNLAALKKILNHNTYIKRKYIEYCFPDGSNIQIKQLLACDSPTMLPIIKESNLPESMKIYIINTLFYFSVCAKAVLETIIAIYPLFMEAQEYFVQHEHIKELLQTELVNEKLYCITKLERHKSFEFSFSIINGDAFYFSENEAEHLLLGYDFLGKLDNQYKYCHVTPLLFAKAIGNAVRYDIFKLLSHNQPMNTGELSSKLNYSRNEISYNIKEMQKTGLVLMKQISGNQYQYKLDRGFLRSINRQLSTI